MPKHYNNNKGGKINYLADDERNAILHFLLQNTTGKKKLKYGMISLTAKRFNTSVNTVRRIWELVIQQPIQNDDISFINVNSKKKGNVGRKKKLYEEELQSLRDMQPCERSTLRSVS